MFKRGETTNVIQKARIRKTRYFYDDSAGFMFDLMQDIKKGIRLANKLGLEPVFRLNGTSDLSWEKYEMTEDMNVFDVFAGIQFYDYTKLPNPWERVRPNYHLTYSYSERTGSWATVSSIIAHGVNVAIVFDRLKGEALPTTYRGIPVLDGDIHDLRFRDPMGHIVGLRFKGGRAKLAAGLAGGFVLPAAH